MRFVQTQGYTIKAGKTREFQAVISENQDRIRKACPDGVEYLGTYAAVYTTEKQAGMMYDLWAFDSYASLDVWSESFKSGDLAHIAADLAPFWDMSNEASWSKTLLKDMTIATVFDATD